MNLFKRFIFIIFIFISCNSFSQTNTNTTYPQSYNKSWFVSSSMGIQISGIKSEDFISSNVAPAFIINIGKWVSPEVALQIGYKGFYFHTISDKDKHYYNFLYGEVLFNIKELLNGKNITKDNWNLLIHPGAGYFYNNTYNRPNICANIGLINSFKIINQIEAFIDISAIMGWDIYQGDEDILPSCVLGLCYSF